MGRRNKTDQIVLMGASFPIAGAVPQTCYDCGGLVYVQKENVPVISASHGRYLCQSCFMDVPLSEIKPGGLMHRGIRYQKPTAEQVSKIVREIMRRHVN